MKSLIGYTGFVGSNLNNQTKFDYLFNSDNINEIHNLQTDLLVIAAPSAVKWKANQEPEQDLQMINDLINHLKKVKAKQVVQISTIDIYKNPNNVDENTIIDTDGLHPYGKNRFYLEEFIRKQFTNHLVVRLPALFGEGLKKNFIYDLLNPIPQLLNENKYTELLKKDSNIAKYYQKESNGNYTNTTQASDNTELIKTLKNINFSSLNFTDSRGIFQFYNLDHLWEHIQIALTNNVETLNIATEPIRINELYKYIKNQDFKNEISTNPTFYNIKTKYSKLYNGKYGYIYNKKFVLQEINQFIGRSNDSQNKKNNF